MITTKKLNKIERIFIRGGELSYLILETLKGCFTRPFYFHRFIEQMVEIGIGSALISGTIGFVIGLVMTLQFGVGLASFGGTFYVPSIVSVSLMRELAPILTSLLVAGRIGSGITAELASMNVTQQIDAIRALGTSPVRVLVVPRVVAAFISLPLLTVFSAFMGLLGGLIISDTEFGIPYGFYINKVLEYLHFYDVLSSMIKSAVFSLIITFIATFQGFRTKEGTRGVGNSTTQVVVTSSILILISDFFLSKFLIYIFLK
jgi:phospholipid/cholesterol/gamma-HCH transport system permease protein